MIDEKKAVAWFLANYRRGKKISDPMEYASCCKVLIEAYGSSEEVAKKLEVGKETIRILSKLTDLPLEVQDLISRRKIHLTVAFDIVPLDRERQVEVARAVSGLSYRDAREIIKQVSENPQKSAEEIRREVLEELEKREINMLMLAFPKEIYKLLQQESKDVPLRVRQIVEDWLAKDWPLDYSYEIKRESLVSLVIKIPRATARALRKKTRKTANLVERIVISWLKQQGKT